MSHYQNDNFSNMTGAGKGGGVRGADTGLCRLVQPFLSFSPLSCLAELYLVCHFPTKVSTTCQPFSKWGIDLIRPLPHGKYQIKFAIVAIDYYTKWVEAEPLSESTEAQTTNFMWKNIIYRFRVPHSLVSDNGTQFDSASLQKLCSKLGIWKHFSSIAHPWSNGQIKAVNKTIKRNLEQKL